MRIPRRINLCSIIKQTSSFASNTRDYLIYMYIRRICFVYFGAPHADNRVVNILVFHVHQPGVVVRRTAIKNQIKSTAV